jgi:hypothetical protein
MDGCRRAAADQRLPDADEKTIDQVTAVDACWHSLRMISVEKNRQSIADCRF